MKKNRFIIDMIKLDLNKDNYYAFENTYGKDIVGQAWEELQCEKKQKKEDTGKTELEEYINDHENYPTGYDLEGEEWKGVDGNLKSMMPPHSEFQGLGNFGAKDDFFTMGNFDEEDDFESSIEYDPNFFGSVDGIPAAELPAEDEEIVTPYIFHAIVRNRSGKIIFDNWIAEDELEVYVFDLFDKVDIIRDEPFEKEYRVIR